MSSQIQRAVIIVIGIALLGLTACSEEAPKKAQPKVVKQKISSTSPASDKKDSATVSAPAKTAPDAKAANEAAMVTKKEDNASDLVQETLEIASTYDPTGRFDPFEPLFQEKPKMEVEKSPKEARKKRVPQTPLERVALSQLKLTAVIRAPSGNRGLVVDATGKGYVVERGTYIGLNSGRVTQIDNDRIIIEEDIEDLMGELTVQKSELKLQKPAGEL